ncbi:MAG: NAD-dependent epimerase/dehydratase family protein [bacterium]|nr:NAD-dependent epimerase/dehydratase family protein [bacterium]
MKPTDPVLVTGATGFIGFHTTRQLLGEGRPVRVLVRDPEKATRVLSPIGIDPGDIFVGDMTDVEAVNSALEGCAGVVHSAAGVSVTGGQSDFSENLRGTKAVIGRACEQGSYALFVSSVTAIFDPARPITEDAPLVRSRTQYGRSKAECDAWVRERQAAGAAISIVYPPGVVGPDDPGFSESVKAYRAFLRGTLQSEGGNQLLDVRDLARLFARMLQSETRGRVIAGGHYFDWDDFTELLERATGATISRIRAPGWVLRVAARAMDVAGAVLHKSMPLTFEGIEIATRFPKMLDSPAIEELGLRWRSPDETIEDLFRWYLEVGKLPAKAVPALSGSD